MWKRSYLLLFAFGLLLCCCGASLQWNASIPDADHGAATGYRIHRGTAPGVYDWQIDVDNTLQWPIPDDLYGSYYWTASAYNSAGSSGYSNEVFWQRTQPQQYVGATNLRASKKETTKMGFSYIASSNGHSDSSGTSLNASSALNVAAGDVVIGVASWEDGTGGTLGMIDTDSSTNPFTMQTAYNSGNCYIAFGVLLNATADSSATFKFTNTTSRGYRSCIFLQFRPDSGDTVSIDVGPSNNGGSGSGSVTTGNIAPTGDDIVVVAAIKEYGGLVETSHTINSVSRDGVVSASSNYLGAWYRILTTGFSSASGACTVPSYTSCWAATIISIKATAGGGASAVPAMMRSYRNRREQ